MIENKLNERQIEQLRNNNEMKLYDFIQFARKNEAENNFIYQLTLDNDEEIIAQFDTEIQLTSDLKDKEIKYCELGFIILKILHKNKDSKLKINNSIYFTYKNFFKSYKLLTNSEFLEKLKPEQLTKYDFAESYNIKSIYTENNNTIKMYLYFHPWMQEKFTLSPKSDTEILIEFFGVRNQNNVLPLDDRNWEIESIDIKNQTLIIYSIYNEQELNISFDFDYAILRTIKEKYIYYYKGKYLND